MALPLATKHSCPQRSLLKDLHGLPGCDWTDVTELSLRSQGP